MNGLAGAWGWKESGWETAIHYERVFSAWPQCPASVLVGGVRPGKVQMLTLKKNRGSEECLSSGSTVLSVGSPEESAIPKVKPIEVPLRASFLSSVPYSPPLSIPLS